MDDTNDVPKPKSRRGFASMDPEKRREAARKGGRTAQERGTGYRFTTETAIEAGKIGGRISRGGRGRLAAPKTSAA